MQCGEYFILPEKSRSHGSDGTLYGKLGDNTGLRADQLYGGHLGNQNKASSSVNIQKPGVTLVFTLK